MTNTLKTRKKLSFGVFAVAATLLVTMVTPIAQADVVYAKPGAPTNVISYLSSRGVQVKWTASATAYPAITHYVVSAGSGSCPIIVPATNRTRVTMPVVVGQPGGTPVVQAVNAYGFSVAAKASTTFTAAQLATVASSSVKSVQVLQLSDLHGAIESSSSNIGAAVLATAFANDRKNAAATITISSGDNIGAAPPISTEFEEMPTIESMNLMKFDASTFGNHEHDRNLAHLQKVIGASDFQWVSSNYGDSSLAELKSGTKAAKSYTIIERGGVKIGIVGSNTETTIEQVFPGNLDYTDASGEKRTIEIQAGVDGINAAIVAAKRDGADLVVAVLHQGWSENVDGVATGVLNDMVTKIKGAAAIYGGHSHQSFSASVPGKLKNYATLVGQVVNSGQEYTRSQICLDTGTGRIIGSSIETIKKAAVASVTADADTAALVKKYKDQMTSKLDLKIGQVSGTFPIDGTPRVQRSGENPMGNYIADLLRSKYKTDFALTNGGGIRDSFPAKGYKPVDTTLVRTGTGALDVTLGDALTVYPFGNQVATTIVTGENLWKALEIGVGGNYGSEGRFPQISGFKFTFDPTKAAGSRIVSVTKNDGTEIAKDQTVYTLTTLDYIVYGGDGYVNVFSPSKAKVMGALLDIFVDALKADQAAGKVTQVPALDGRIKKVA
ncbi:UshA 5'-nucleotidase/2',3'-cyclic phosphodiesterase and related esterases [Candidatus Nanopelagicaceae bacterium]